MDAPGTVIWQCRRCKGDVMTVPLPYDPERDRDWQDRPLPRGYVLVDLQPHPEGQVVIIDGVAYAAAQHPEQKRRYRNHWRTCLERARTVLHPGGRQTIRMVPEHEREVIE